MKIFSRQALVFAFIYSLVAGNAIAQNSSSTLQTFYFNDVWELTTQEKSTYRREAFFDLANVVFDGIYSDYDKDNRMIADGTYHEGERSGIHTVYASDFSVKSKIEYNGNDFTIWELPNEEADKGVKNGNGKFTIPYYYLADINGKTIWKAGSLEGEYMNGKKTGYWIYFVHPNQPTPSDVEIYKNGKFLEHKRYGTRDSVNIMGQKVIYLSLPMLTAEALIHDNKSFTHLNQYFEQYIKYPDNFHRTISFPGGYKRFLAQLAQQCNVQESYMEVIKVRIDEHGLAQKATIARSVDATIDNFALAAFQLFSKRILPAMKNGKPMVYTIYIPISGGNRWASALLEFPNEWFYDVRNFLD